MESSSCEGVSVRLHQEVIRAYGMDYDIQTTNLCLKTRTSNTTISGQRLTHKSEFILLNTCGMHLLPDPVQSYRHQL